MQCIDSKRSIFFARKAIRAAAEAFGENLLGSGKTSSEGIAAQSDLRMGQTELKAQPVIIRNRPANPSSVIEGSE